MGPGGFPLNFTRDPGCSFPCSQAMSSPHSSSVRPRGLVLKSTPENAGAHKPSCNTTHPTGVIRGTPMHHCMSVFILCYVEKHFPTSKLFHPSGLNNTGICRNCTVLLKVQLSPSSSNAACWSPNHTQSRRLGMPGQRILQKRGYLKKKKKASLKFASCTTKMRITS